MLTAWQPMSALFDPPDQDVTMTAASLIASGGYIAFVGACLAPAATFTAETRCQARQIAWAALPKRAHMVDNIST